MPGDQSYLYTSPWAGGNFSTVSADDDAALEYDKISFTNLKRLIEKFGPEAGLKMLPATELFECDFPSQKKIDHLKSYIPDFEVLSKDQLPGDATFGIKFTTINFFCPKFITFLQNYMKERGAIFLKRKLENINDAFSLFPDNGNKESKTKVVFNCTGIGAHSLGGVQDPKVYPTRGQVVVVRAPHIQENKALVTEFFDTYIIPRPYSNGHVILGGYMQKNNWRGFETNAHETASILERTCALLPEINDHGRKPIEIIREASGLRPSRVGGARIEREDLPDGGIIIHNYGAGGTGYQSGYGMAYKAVKLWTDSNSKL